MLNESLPIGGAVSKLGLQALELIEAAGPVDAVSCDNFDIVIGPFLTDFSALPHPHAPCAVLWFGPMLIGVLLRG